MTHLVRWGGPPPTGDTQNARDSYDLGSSDAAILAAAAEWCATVSELEVFRTRLQSRRHRSDADVVSRFGENWLHAIPIDPSRQAEYEMYTSSRRRCVNVARSLAS